MIECFARVEGVENLDAKERHLVKAILRNQFGDSVVAVADVMMGCADGATLKDIEKRVPGKHQPIVRRAMAPTPASPRSLACITC